MVPPYFNAGSSVPRIPLQSTCTFPRYNEVTKPDAFYPVTFSNDDIIHIVHVETSKHFESVDQSAAFEAAASEVQQFHDGQEKDNPLSGHVFLAPEGAFHFPI